MKPKTPAELHQEWNLAPNPLCRMWQKIIQKLHTLFQGME